MAVTSSDLLFKYSVKSGSAGNQVVGNATGSLGRYISTTQVSTAKNGLFDDVSGAENAASAVDYRCLFVHNNHATLTYQNAAVYVSAEVAGGASVELGVDAIGYTIIDYSTASQASEIVNEVATPTGSGSFSAPTTPATGISLGDIPAGCCRAAWVKRTAANTSAVTNDGFTFGVTGDSAA
jgi:hypothetical protein